MSSLPTVGTFPYRKRNWRMDCFVYGTLTDPGRVDDLLDGWAFGPTATLRGLHRVSGRYPTLAPGGETTGRILRVEDIDALDAYEGVDRGLYTRVGVPRDDREGQVQTYVGDPTRLGVADPVDWPGTGTLFERIESFVAAHCTVILSDE
jgi:hypothetical protein